MNELIVGVCGCALLFVGVVVIQELVFNSQKKMPRHVGAEKTSQDKTLTVIANAQSSPVNKNLSSQVETKSANKKSTQPTEAEETVVQLENAITLARKTLRSLGRTEDNEDHTNSSSHNSFVDDLQRLIDMKEKGFLTDSEFLEAKKRVIGKN